MVWKDNKRLVRLILSLDSLSFLDHLCLYMEERHIDVTHFWFVTTFTKMSYMFLLNIGMVFSQFFQDNRFMNLGYIRCLTSCLHLHL